jgi:hypothetical protein
MPCQQCGDYGLEFAGAKKEFARCTKCLALHHSYGPGHQVLMDVRAPNGQIDPQFTAMYAQQLGFAPRQAQTSVVGIGGVNVIVPTAKIERDIKNKISSIIWGWIIGAFILLVMAIIGVVLFFWVRGQQAQIESGMGPGAGAGGGGAQKTVSWDGKSPFTCGGNDNVLVKGTTASLPAGPAVTAAGNCALELDDVNITAPQGISALGNVKVVVKGGSIKSNATAIMAMGNATVDVQGATVSGKTQAMGAAKITGVK